MANERVLVSPGVFIRELDGTIRPNSPVGVGAAVVAPRAKGPAMVPVLVQDRDEDQKLFGLPSSNGKDFGAYTARTYLNVQTNPLTMVRVLGMDDTGVVPGFNLSPATSGLYALGASGSTGGVVALILSSGTLSMAGALTSSVDNLAISIAGYGDVTASLNKSSSKYIKKVLNTDPTQFHTLKHVVYAVYDYGSKTPNSNNAFFAQKIAGGNNWQDSFVTGSTTVVISQPFSNTEYDLFGIGNIFAGDSANTEFKVSVTNIKKSSNESQDPFGTFSILVRAFDDNDRNPVVLESFSNLSLNPDADNYVCKMIGDTYLVWNKTTKKFDEFGEFPNKSKYIYVIPSTDLKNGNAPESSLPWGFKGYRTFASGAIDSKAPFPEMPFVNNLLYKNDFNLNVCWGVAVIDNASGSVNAGIVDRLKHINNALSSVSGSAGQKFSLKWISGSVQSAVGFSDTTRLTDVQVNALSTSISMNTGTLIPAPSGSSGYSGYLSLENIENTRLAKFTLPMMNGFDGVDIFRVNPFDPADMSSVSSYQTYAYRTAVDMLGNPDTVELTDLSIPGIWAQKVADYAVDMVEGRGDMFYLMDVSGSTVSDVIDNVSARNIDTNYAACYYSWLQLTDDVNRKVVSVPPTVVMPAVYSYNDSVAFAWYAPAGMSRGALTRHGVVKAKDKLTKVERDRLYENRINPIASFTNSGPVVWGQKTLQQALSALDRVNVRRMMLRVRKLIAKRAHDIVFEPNVPAVWSKFIASVEPELERIRQNFGIAEFKLVLDESTTTEDLIERNVIYGKFAIKPTRTAEFFWFDIFLTNNVSGFEE